MRRKIAKGLLRQKDVRSRRRQMLMCSIGLALLFVVHAFFTNLETPLKLIPQTAAAMAMGWMLLTIYSVYEFAHIAEFIDWDKVASSAEPSAEEARRST